MSDEVNDRKILFQNLESLIVNAKKNGVTDHEALGLLRLLGDSISRGVFEAAEKKLDDDEDFAKDEKMPEKLKAPEAPEVAEALEIPEEALPTKDKKKKIELPEPPEFEDLGIFCELAGMSR